MFEITGNLRDLRVKPETESPIWICSPYVTEGGVQWLDESIGFGKEDEDGGFSKCRLLTCLQPSSVANGAIDLTSLWDLYGRGVEVRSLANLHAKILVKGDVVVFGSANLTRGGVTRNREIVCRPTTPQFSLDVRALFDRYWSSASPIGKEEINRCARDAEFAELQLSDSGSLAAQWNEQFALVTIQVEVLKKIRQIELPASVLGYSEEDRRRIEESVNPSEVSRRTNGEGS